MVNERVRVAMTLEQCWHRVPGGTAVAAIGMATALRDRGIVEPVGVAARHRDRAPAAWKPPIEVKYLGLPRVALYESWHRLRRPHVESATGRVDAIHATTFAIPPRTAPLIVTVHDLAFIHEPTHFTKRGLAFFHRGLDLARDEADVIHCPSQATADDCIAHGFARDKVRVIPLGVETTAPSADEIAKVKAEWSIDEPYVMWSGTKEPRKNLRGLLEAWKIAARAKERLVLVGPSGWGEGWDDELRSAGRVMSIGFVDARSLRALYAGASAFCWPSIREGFGFPVLEAMAEGCPVITSRGTSTEEIVGEAGMLVDPNDPNEIAAALSALLDDPARARDLAQRGRERAASYTWDRTGEMLEDAYRAGIAVAA